MIVLEFVAGGELYEFVAHRRFSPSICKRFFMQILHGVHYMHDNNVCHRDFKPENILLDQNFNVKLADFGYASTHAGTD